MNRNELLNRLTRDLDAGRVYPDGTVLRWEHVLGNRVYNYAAIFADGKWFTTAQQGSLVRPHSNSELMEYLNRHGDAIRLVQVATEWDTVRG